MSTDSIIPAWSAEILSFVSPRAIRGVWPGQCTGFGYAQWVTQSSFRVVIAEDEALIRLDLKEMLEDEEGLRRDRRGRRRRERHHLTADLSPDLVILDVKMPVLDGISAAERIAARPLAPVVILTAFSQRELVERARDAGAMAYLVKPFTKADLVPAIEIAVSRFAEITALESEIGDAARAAGDAQAARPGQGPAAGAARDDRARGVPVDPEDLDGPPDDDAGGRPRRYWRPAGRSGGRRGRSRRGGPAGDAGQRTAGPPRETGLRPDAGPPASENAPGPAETG